jgi:hypothetical protein
MIGHPAQAGVQMAAKEAAIKSSPEPHMKGFRRAVLYEAQGSRNMEGRLHQPREEEISEASSAEAPFLTRRVGVHAVQTKKWRQLRKRSAAIAQTCLFFQRPPLALRFPAGECAAGGSPARISQRMAARAAGRPMIKKVLPSVPNSGKTTGTVTARAVAPPTVTPVVMKPVAEPTFRGGNQRPASFGRFGNTMLKPTPKRPVQARSEAKPVDAPLVRLPTAYSVTEATAGYGEGHEYDKGQGKEEAKGGVADVHLRLDYIDDGRNAEQRDIHGKGKEPGARKYYPRSLDLFHPADPRLLF